MFKLKAPSNKYTREIAGVHFIDGKAETENEEAARWLEGRGFEVESDNAGEKKAASKRASVKESLRMQEMPTEDAE